MQKIYQSKIVRIYVLQTSYEALFGRESRKSTPHLCLSNRSGSFHLCLEISTSNLYSFDPLFLPKAMLHLHLLQRHGNLKNILHGLIWNSKPLGLSRLYLKNSLTSLIYLICFSQSLLFSTTLNWWYLSLLFLSHIALQSD